MAREYRGERSWETPMRRRDLLSIAVLTPFLPALVEPRSAFATPTSKPNGARRSRVRPGDPGWPSESAWLALKQAVGGNLLKTAPLFAACESKPDGNACREILQNMRNPFYLGEQPSGTQISGWLDAWTPAASAYAVRARNP